MGSNYCKLITRCWSLFFLASTLAINPELWKQQVSRLGEVVTGPAQNMSLILQFDPDLPSDVQRTVLQKVHHVPHLILPLGHNFTLWISPHNCLHIALLTRKHQMLVSYPPPRHLLLLALDLEVDASLLKEVGSRVKSLAFISMNGAVYTLLPFSSPRPVLLGQWHPKHFPLWNSLFKNRFLHFYHHTFHLAGWNADRPFLYTNNLNGGIHAGVAVQMLSSLSGPLNFTYTLTKEPPDLQWGNYINEKWTGLFGMVDRGEKYFTVNNLYPSPERHRDFDMSPPCWADSFAAFLLRPLPLPAWSNMHRPFTFPVWSAFVAIMVPAHLFLYLNIVINGKAWTGNASGTWLYIIKGMLRQSMPKIPRYVSLRVFLTFWFFGSFVMGASYTCNLVALLTSPAYPQPLRSLQQLANTNFRLAAVNYGGLLQEVLKGSKVEAVVMLKSKEDLFEQERDAIAAMLRGSHAFVEAKTYAQTQLYFRYKVYDSYVVNERLYSTFAFWYFPKYTPWKFLFDKGIQRLVEGGFIDYWLKLEEKKVTRKGQNIIQQKEGGVPLTLQHLEGNFYILFFSCIIAAIAFLLEHLNHGFSCSL